MISFSRARGRADAPRALRSLALPLLTLIAALVLLRPQLAALDLGLLAEALRAIPPGAWAGALLATAVSFAALGRYDALWHDMLRTGVSHRAARVSGMCAVAVGQTLGLSALTGAAARWRALPGVAALTVVKVTGGVALSFMACWALAALVAVSALPAQSGIAAPAPWLVLPLIALVAGTGLRIARARGVPLRAALAMLGWSVLDMGAAAVALWLLMPAGAVDGLALVAAAYVLALGAALLGGTPGGVGSFEVVLLALLAPVPGAGAEPLLAGVLAFRLVYYLVPFTLAALVLARRAPAPAPAPLPAGLPPALAAPADWQLAAQGARIGGRGAAALVLRTAPGHLVALGDAAGTLPPAPRARLALDGLRAQAAWEGRAPALYKGSARTAAIARRAGWAVLHVADEAVIDPQTWATSGAARQGLRRKLRQAAEAGVSVRPAGDRLPHAAMGRIAAAWARAHGGEMGFSMGTYAPDYVALQAVFLISDAHGLRGFVTFQTGARDWALDLIRYDGALPPGAVQAAIVAAIAAARAAGIARLSLAAVPAERGVTAPLARRRAGLAQFKRSFAPRWEPRYHAAPHRAGLWLSLLAVMWEIHRGPLAARLRARPKVRRRAPAPTGHPAT